MKHEDNPERQRIILQALSATSLAQIEAAEQALDAWLEANPDDLSMEDAYEQLALMRLSAKAIEQTTPSPLAIK
jgi:vacuolar-type H+-ATPase subunit E/Vma4